MDPVISRGDGGGRAVPAGHDDTLAAAWPHAASLAPDQLPARSRSAARSRAPAVRGWIGKEMTLQTSAGLRLRALQLNSCRAASAQRSARRDALRDGARLFMRGARWARPTDRVDRAPLGQGARGGAGARERVATGRAARPRPAPSRCGLCRLALALALAGPGSLT
ncbi:hypothetical protein GUJ93_ZPchr0002g23461 [Zizania palustris]|uniref:Uncharacterized protein n=1 Tax=Zizania palustris TaxID=103762 RepID=A0A8J5RV79_ZIZPA|nr:hypothetical protein GUJ93_ZPchr0002g23461 [Zizania palustris]